MWFDLGLTLIHNTLPDNYYETLREFSKDITKVDIEKAYHQTNKYFFREFPGVMGKEKKDYYKSYVGVMLKYLECDIPLETFITSLSAKKVHWMKYNWTDEVLDQIKKKGISVGLISNWDLSCRTILKELGLYEKLEEIFISSEVGYEKPAKEIFQKALDQVMLDPEECLYVGDNYYDDFCGASKVGMPCVIINSKDRLGIEELNYNDIVEDTREIFKYLP